MTLIYKKRHRVVGDFLFGLAFLFWSLVMLSEAGKSMDMAHNTDVIEFFSSFDTESYGSIFIFLAIGTLITCIVQSSAAVMAITILLCSTGVLPIYLGIALVMGENIGTTTTANIAAFYAGTTARRAALAHLLFNIFGVCWILVIFYPFVDMVCSMAGYVPDGQGQAARLPVVLALFHTCFNVLNTAVLFAFVPQMERLVCKLIPEKHDETPENKRALHFINVGLMATPEISVLQAQKEIVHFTEITHRMFNMTRSMFYENDNKEIEREFERICKYEDIADNIEYEIANYLEKVSNEHLSDDTKKKIRSMLRQIGELESVADSCYKMARALKQRKDKHDDFTELQYAHINEMLTLINEAMAQMMVVVSGRRENLTIMPSIEIESDINSLRDRLKAESIAEIDSHSYARSVLYTDIISECERLGDYIINVVEARLGKQSMSFKGLQIREEQKQVDIDGTPVNLTRTEFELLIDLMSHRGQVRSRQQLMDNIWNGVIVTAHTVDVNVARLRKKLGPYAQNIVNKQGFGYYFDDEI